MRTRRNPTRLAAALILLAAIAPARAEITAMSRERLPEAEQAGRRATEDTAIIFEGTCRTRAKFGSRMFDVRITTPFAAVATAVFEYRKRGRPLDLGAWPIEAAGKQAVIVSVDPAALSPGGLPAPPPVSVGKVMLRRGALTIEPKRSDTHDVVFPQFDEQHRKVRGGAWYFALEPFASAAGDLEIVVIPEAAEPGAEAVLELSQSLLAGLR